VEVTLHANEEGWLPLHMAAEAGHAAVVQQLLHAAPQAALMPTPNGCLPLHVAVGNGHTSVVQHLLDAVPKAAMQATRAGQLPLHLALPQGHGVPHFAAASLLLRAAAAPRLLDLSILLARGPRGLHLLADFVIARVPLSPLEWQLIPAPCPGILRALPAALTRSADQAREIVHRLSPIDAAWLRTALLCLHVSQRRCRMFLPSDIFPRILMHAFDCDAL
jgi:hypothetical protein